MALPESVRVIRGDTWQRAWVISDGAGAPVDLTGCTARLQVRDSAGELQEEAISGGRLLMEPLAGRIDLVMPADAMALLSGRYRFDLEVTFPTGVVRTYEINSLVVLEDVSRD